MPPKVEHRPEKCIIAGADSIFGDNSEETIKLLKLRKELQVEDGVLIFRRRPVIPQKLRSKALDLLNAAHQGTSKMVRRAEAAVFWPLITLDIKQEREPVIPSYPFQHISADHLNFSGHMYGVIVDRFSNWYKVYEGKETITTYGGSQYVLAEAKAFYAQYGIQHRLTSVGNPHANTRAELAVKSAKRMLRGNIGTDGSLDNVKMSRALMAHRNTPDELTGLSPSEMLIGRKIRDFFPSQMMENLPPIAVGTNVLIQNLLCNHPRRWDKRGVMVETLPYQQYKIRVDGSRRITLRNRRFLKPFTPMFEEKRTFPSSPYPSYPDPAAPKTDTSIPSGPPANARQPVFLPHQTINVPQQILTAPQQIPTVPQQIPTTPRHETVDEQLPQQAAVPDTPLADLHTGSSAQPKKSNILKRLAHHNIPGPSEQQDGTVLEGRLRSKKV